MVKTKVDERVKSYCENLCRLKDKCRYGAWYLIYIGLPTDYEKCVDRCIDELYIDTSWMDNISKYVSKSG